MFPFDPPGTDAPSGTRYGCKSNCFSTLQTHASGIFLNKFSTSVLHTASTLHVAAKEGFDSVERYFVHIVVKICMHCSGNNQQLLVVPFQLFESILAEITGMGIFPVHEKDGTPDLSGIGEYGHIEER